MRAKGTPKTGGRQPGTPNVLTSELRTLLKNIMQKEIESIPAYLQSLDLNTRIEIVIKLLPYVLPRIEPVRKSEDEPFEPDWLR